MLVCDKRIISRLIIPESIEKMFKIDGHIGIATSDLLRMLVNSSPGLVLRPKSTASLTVPPCLLTSL